MVVLEIPKCYLHSNWKNHLANLIVLKIMFIEPLGPKKDYRVRPLKIVIYKDIWMVVFYPPSIPSLPQFSMNFVALLVK